MVTSENNLFFARKIKTTINMNTKTMLIGLLAVMFSSCVNGIDDFDVLGIKSTISGESYLSPIGGQEYESDMQLKNSGLELKNFRLLDIEKNDLSLSDFLDGTDALFPVYPKDLTYFELAPYASLDKDSAGFHFVSYAISDYIDSLLHDPEKYRVYEQSWNYRGRVLKTLSLYTAENELVYDNIRFNMITVHQVRYDSNRRRMLSRSEGPYAGNGSALDYVCFRNRIDSIVAESWIWWEEYGHMQGEPFYNVQTGQLNNVYYHYVHDCLNYGGDTYVLNDYLTAINRFVDYSDNDAGRFSYCIWAGPTSYYQDDRLSIQLNFAYPFVPNNHYDYTRIINDGTSWTSCTINGRFNSFEIKTDSYSVDY